MNWNDLLKKYFVETLEYIKSSAPNVKNEAALYIQELIKWEIFGNLLFSMLYLFLLVPCFFVFVKCIKKENIDDSEICILFISGVLILLLGGFFIESSSKSIKAYVAPRVFIIEKLTKELK